MPDSPPSRRWYIALAIAFTGFAIYASLIPFNLRALSFDEATEIFRDAIITWPARVSRSDALANTLLFVPIGFSVAGAVLVNRSIGWLSTLRMLTIVFPVSLAASVSSEFLQTFTSDRVTSIVDIVS